MAKTSSDSEKKNESNLDNPETWKAFGIKLAWNLLYFIIFAVMLANIIYLKLISKVQLNWLLPTDENDCDLPQSGGGKLQCEGYPARAIPKWPPSQGNLPNGITNSPFPNCEQYKKWAHPQTSIGDIMNTGFVDWFKVSTVVSYETMRRLLKGYLGFGFMENSSSMLNNMFFQGLLFIITFYLGGAFLFPVLFVANWLLSIPNNWLWGILFGWLFSLFISTFQIIQLMGTLLFSGISMDKKTNDLKSIKKILECNIPALIFMLGLQIVYTSGSLFGGTMLAGMVIWLAYATNKSRKNK